MWAPKPAKLAGSWGVGGVEGWVGRLEAAAEDSAFKHSTLISQRRFRRDCFGLSPSSGNRPHDGESTFGENEASNYYQSASVTQ